MQPFGGKKPCHCGSGKKYKRCHGPSDRAFALAGLRDIKAREALRQKQQGMGRGIVSEQLNGFRMVAVGDTVHVGRWGTFHTFLTEHYLPTVFGASWMQVEAAKQPEDRHELLLWAERVRVQDEHDHRNPGLISVSDMSGAVACYLSLAYDLYCIKHNADLQAKLIARMKVKDQFHSARYEARIAAAFVRAGFAVEFEDEEDGSSKHHEFTATSKTGRQFSVECKRRAGSQSVRIGQLFNDAQRNALNKTTVGLGANYALSPQWTLLGGVHQGFAPPGSGVANGTKGEESTNFEGGVRYRQGSLGFDAIAFYSDYTNAMRNCLVANPCPGGAIEGTQQTGEKKVYGLEFGLFADLQRGTGPRLPLRLAYTYTDGEYTKASDVAGGVLDGDVLEYAFKHMASVQLGMESAGGWKSYAALNYVSDACTTNTCGRAGVDTRFLRTESLLTLDLSTAYPLGSGVEVYARVDNVFDERSITSRGPDGARGNAGRAFAVGLRASF